MYQTAPSIWTIGGDKPVILGVTFLSDTASIKKARGFTKPGFRPCIPCCSEYSQTSFCLRTQLQISKLDELVFGSYRYVFDRAPPQSNCPPAAVPIKSKQSHQRWVVLHGRSTLTKMRVSTLLLILCISNKITTTSCSKVPQGLRFPLGVRGLFTTRYFQKALTRDSDNLVKPFMQVAIHTTRYYATLRGS